MDKRLNPLRNGVANTPQVFTVRDPVAPLLRAPRPDAMRDTELLFGEDFAVYETDMEGWCWGQSLRDSYCGYIAKDALGAKITPTHRVCALRSFIYPVANIKAPPIMALGFGAQLEIIKTEADFLLLSNGFFIWATHTAPLDAPETDYVAVAEQFIGTPYLWGGRSSLGLDCSALVQLSLQVSGQPAPRDSDMQERELGSPVNGPFQRGDLVFWSGHVGIMQNGTRLLHANGFTMSVYSEPLETARTRIMAKGGGDVTSLKRL